MKMFSALVAIVSIGAIGCGHYDCEGVWTYDSKEWPSQERSALMMAARDWNEFAGHEVVRIEERTVTNQDMCKIYPGPAIKGNEIKAGMFHGPSDGSIEINSSRLRTLVPASEFTRYLYAIILHEVGHGLGMDHVEGTNNIMYPVQGYTTWGPEDKQECLDKGICSE